MVLIPSSVPILIARAIQGLFSAAVITLSSILISGQKMGPMPPILVAPVAVGLSTLTAAVLLAAADVWDFLHPWVGYCIDGGIVLLNVAIGVEISSELQGYNCDIQAIVPTFEASDIVCGGMSPLFANDRGNYSNGEVNYTSFYYDFIWLERCYYYDPHNYDALWNRCVIGTSNAALLFTMPMVLLCILALKYFKTENGWKIGGWRVEKVKTSDALSMPHLKSLLPATILRALQLLLGIITLGLSVTLLKGWAPSQLHFSGPPVLLPFSAGVGGVTLIGAVLGLALAWTEFLRGYFEVVIDIMVLLANMAGGMLLAMRVQSKNCFDTSSKNKWGNGEFPFKGSLAGIDILNGGCNDEYCYYFLEDGKHLNTRCKQSQADSVFMFLTAVLLFGVLVLAYRRMKRG
ncbi:hypothetical protein PTTW11_09640 [Pyrenophora teres f. teres]|uniref:MARVEL domain-containing protein n=1 Tax=Pyrenophora teres f. teres TaxID=97479 RepID=A0A6S6WD19_9PLEO|nr:hypothetical protein PTTW11_09640 [Pyrenophora teres f. teres]